MALARLNLSLILAGTLVMSLVAFASNIDGLQLASRLGIRGPVKQCIEQHTFPVQADVGEWTYTREWMFTPDGRRLRSGTGIRPKPNSVTTYTYDAAGHVLGSWTGNPSQEVRFST